MADFFSQPIVCNTGPLIALSRASIGHLLPKLFPRVITTTEVVAELTAKDSGDADEVFATLSGIEVVKASAPDPLLTVELDAGEASVIQAARDLDLRAVLLDERRARRIAAEVYKLEVRGTCALLVQAKRALLINEVRPLMETMIKGGYFIGPALMNETLKRAGE